MIPNDDARSGSPPPGPDELETLRTLGQRFGMEWMPSVPDDVLVPEWVRPIPVEWARTHALLPVRFRGDACILTDDPGRLQEREYAALVTAKDLKPVLAPRAAILDAIERCYFRRENSPGEFLRELPAAGAGGPPRSGADDLLQVADQAPVTQLVNLILLEAVKRSASDIHFEPFESHLQVRYRIDGILYEQSAPPKHLEDALVSRLKVMARMDTTERRLPQDGMARVRIGEREIDIRVSTIPVAEGERVVLRLLDRDSALLPLTDLGMEADMLSDFSALLSQASGIVVVCGPTGSGKTTTLYAALGQLNARRRNILTIEDPIEYQLPYIGQMQVKPKIGLTFAAGLRHLLRQDPDVILVGETRDLETAEIAIRASLTGHLVFTTLHTNDAPGAVIRMMDMGVEPYLLVSSLRGVLAQRLVRKLCPACRVPAAATNKERSRLGALAPRIEGQALWTSRGCPECREGFRGRTGVFELLVVTKAVQEAVRSRQGPVSLDDLRSAAKEHDGTEGLLSDGLRKALRGVTSLEEVLRAIG